ncbi:MAG: metallophosphoesterase [Thermodesulfovibrionales bacterium]|nr:metallophosphoesterase [Thermodesulfovibrionales bacterium]
MPIVVRVFYAFGNPIKLQVFAYVAFTWMGFLFIFSLLLLFNDLLKVPKSYFSKFFPIFKSFSPKKNFLLLFCLAIILLFYGFFEASHVKVHKIVIRSDKLNNNIDGIKIVQISDLHIGPILREKRLKKIAKIINELEPDILVATGDIVDGQINNQKELIEPFNQIQTRYGKYAVLGNHEFYVGVEQAVDFLQKAGFTVLRGEFITILDKFNIAGIDDPVSKNFGNTFSLSEKEILSRLPQDKYSIFLKHRPDVKADYLGLFDLQLSGHTHKGQIFPLSVITFFYYEAHTGLHFYPPNSYLYISRGVGTSGPPIRILSPPEIVLINVLPNKD